MPQAVNSEAPTFPDQEKGVRKNQNGQGETITCSEDYILKKVQIVLIKPSVMYFCCMQNYMQVPVFRQGTVCIKGNRSTLTRVNSHPSWPSTQHVLSLAFYWLEIFQQVLR